MYTYNYISYLICLVWYFTGTQCGTEPGWILRRDPPRCYYVSEPLVVYTEVEAMAECAARGANLSCISTPDEMDFVRNVVFG